MPSDDGAVRDAAPIDARDHVGTAVVDDVERQTLLCVMCHRPVEDRGSTWECDEHGHVRAVWDAEAQEPSTRPFSGDTSPTDCDDAQSVLMEFDQ